MLGPLRLPGWLALPSPVALVAPGDVVGLVNSGVVLARDEPVDDDGVQLMPGVIVDDAGLVDDGLVDDEFVDGWLDVAFGVVEPVAGVCALCANAGVPLRTSAHAKPTTLLLKLFAPRIGIFSVLFKAFLLASLFCCFRG